MKIAILVYAKPEKGLGHWYRSQTLARKALERGHSVIILGNLMPRPWPFFQVRENEPDDLYHVIDQCRPDLLVIDIQERVPQYIYDLASPQMKIVVLNGVGRAEEQKADLSIIQGYSKFAGANTYVGPEYVILRPELFEHFKAERSGAPGKFVFGGAKDKMDLLSTMCRIYPHSPLILLGVRKYMTPEQMPTASNHFHAWVDGTPRPDDPTGLAGLLFARSCQKAVVAMGMIAWEMAAIKMPTYVFSWSEGHLEFAKEMEQKGLIRAWPAVGLPSDAEIKEFVETPFTPTGQAPDQYGADRVLTLMENIYAKQ